MHCVFYWKWNPSGANVILLAVDWKKVVRIEWFAIIAIIKCKWNVLHINTIYTTKYCGFIFWGILNNLFFNSRIIFESVDKQLSQHVGKMERSKDELSPKNVNWNSDCIILMISHLNCLNIWDSQIIFKMLKNLDWLERIWRAKLKTSKLSSTSSSTRFLIIS